MVRKSLGSKELCRFDPGRPHHSVSLVSLGKFLLVVMCVFAVPAKTCRAFAFEASVASLRTCFRSNPPDRWLELLSRGRFQICAKIIRDDDNVFAARVHFVDQAIAVCLDFNGL